MIHRWDLAVKCVSGLYCTGCSPVKTLGGRVCERESEWSLTGVECCFEGLDISGHP